MKIVNFKGGLGNQLFQYAFLCALKHYHPQEECFMDISSYDDMAIHNGFELLNVFDIDDSVADKTLLERFIRHKNKGLFYGIRLKLIGPYENIFLETKSYRYYEGALTSDKEYYDGYWQSHQYFDSISDKLRSKLLLRHPLDSDNQKLYDSMLDSASSVSIHVRRGDFLQSPLYSDLCGLGYYLKAIRYVKSLHYGRLSYFIFSNDIEWCKSNICPILGKNDNCAVIDCNNGINSYKDMILMSACKYNIIANSSFSWWAAFLNRHSGNIVISPEKWVNQELEYDMHMPSWIKI